MMKRNWIDFYLSVDIHKEIESQSTIHAEFIDVIVKHPGKTILEVGSGSGALSFAILKRKTSTLLTVDNKLEILKKVKAAAQKLGLSVTVVCADAFNLPFKKDTVDTVFSQGLLEHFNDRDIEGIIKEKLRVARGNIIFSVPNSYYRHKDFGNERLLPKEQWETLLFKFSLLRSINYYYLRTKRNLLRRLPLMYMCEIKH
jgi:ubiquinone/menaquinone biosynthesis C-methylase UbiE